MDDRKLLELAARACGYDTSHPWNAERLTMDPPIASLCIDGVSTGWNPIKYDEYAFRLATKLRMDVQNSIGDTCRVEIWNPVTGEYIPTEESHGDDAAAATRRAIVRAAAAIAQEMTDDQG